uniref:Uncharacterized protein n=1 Tax=Eutreptiella gymnastica TaxID=73025 RepID=A0A7S4CGZ3_9EUGL|mmetsp:Transcript_82983/g.138687  ORF Transcript_82983/g.138687 Transcript_82983/m.138687 type:complete len:111 (+) Transcript_82983:164-496(+)
MHIRSTSLSTDLGPANRTPGPPTILRTNFAFFFGPACLFIPRQCGSGFSVSVAWHPSLSQLPSATPCPILRRMPSKHVAAVWNPCLPPFRPCTVLTTADVCGSHDWALIH